MDNTANILLANQEYEDRKKSKPLAYVLWLLLGMFAAHRFYSGQTGYAIAMLLLGWFTLGIWNLIDVFLVGGAIDRRNNDLKSDIYRKYGIQ